MSAADHYAAELERLAQQGNLRVLPEGEHAGRDIVSHGRRMLNLSSNDYLGLATDGVLRGEFLRTLTAEGLDMTSSSSRLLTGNYPVYAAVEDLLARLFGREAALVFNSGYHANTGILPALADERTLILADKLVHASLIDGLRLSAGRCVRFRHQDYDQLERLVAKNQADYDRLILVVESVYSMDGDLADLPRLVRLKQAYPHVMLYVDEAHAVGVFGAHGLGLAEAQGCIADIDLLCGTFGKALASAGAYVVCSQLLRTYLVNRMRTLIFTTALPPINWQWTLLVLQHLASFADRRKRLLGLADLLRAALKAKGYDCPSESHIVPLTVGPSPDAVRLAEHLQRQGFYVLPVRPPTVPEGTARLRFSLTASMTEADIRRLIHQIPDRP